MYIYIYIHILYITCSNQLKPFQLGISGTPRTEFPAFPATTDGSLGIPPQHCCLLQDGRILRLSVAIQLHGDLTGQPVLAVSCGQASQGC